MSENKCQGCQYLRLSISVLQSTEVLRCVSDKAMCDRQYWVEIRPIGEQDKMISDVCAIVETPIKEYLKQISTNSLSLNISSPTIKLG